MSNCINTDVEDYIQFAEAKGASLVTPKLVEIIRVSPFAHGNLGLTTESDFLFEGVRCPTSLLKQGKRTVFDPDPIEIDGKLRYIEYKGFGRNGKEMYLRKHSGDDVHFGMFLDEAEKEFNIGSYLVDSGCKNIPIPLAYGRIKKEDYFVYCLASLKNDILALCSNDAGGVVSDYPSKKNISTRKITKSMFPDLAKQWETIDIIIEQDKKELKAFNSEHRHLSEDSLFKAKLEFIRTKSKYQSSVIPEVRSIADKIYERIIEPYYSKGDEHFIKFVDELGLSRLIDAFATNREVGVVIRAVKSPLRVGEAGPIDKDGLMNIDERYIELIPQYGETFRIMLENGVAHFMSHPYNWTTAGETVDMEDADFFVDRNDIINNKKAIIHNHRNLFRKLKYEAGCGDLFIKGMFGKVLNVNDATQKAYEILLSSRIN